MTRRDRYAFVHALGSEHTTIFIDDGAPQALVGCHENRMAELKRYAHRAYQRRLGSQHFHS